MKIEHWHSQSRYAGEALDYQNLLGACRGNEGQPKSLQHCDTSKGDSVLSRNPANPADNVETHVVYLGDGRISSRDTQFQNELEAVLNLNTPRLVNNRKATLDAFTQAIPLTGKLTRPKLEKWMARWSGEESAGDIEPFSGVVTFWLQKKLQKKL